MTLDDSYREMCLEVEALRVSLARKVRHCDEITEERDKALRERDEARAELAFIRAEYANARNEELTEDALALKIAALVQERDEARADVDMLEDRLSESRSEVERLTSELQRERIGIRPVDEVRSDAYRRGAEAMRDECIGAACGFYMGTTGFCNGDEDELEAVLEALPIPEEP